jgi:ribulose-phosphate 3-epimerase
MTYVVPAILPQDFADLEAHMARVKGLVDRVQIDVANGTYAPTTTWPFSSDDHFTELVKEDEGLPFWRELETEIDMLVVEPEKHLESWIHVGMSAAVIHIESTLRHAEIAEQLRDQHIELGWGMIPNTPNATLFELVERVGMPAFVQLMGNDRIGYHGVELDERVYEKVRAIRERFSDLVIAVDIGVNEETAPYLVDAGVTKLVSGSAVFDAADVDEAITFFESLS